MKFTTLLILGLTLSFGQQVKEWCTEGQKCIEKGDGLAAAQYYRLCCDSLSTGKSITSLSSSLYNISRMYEEAGDYEEAEKYILRSIGLGEVLTTGSLVLRYQEASRIYLAQGKLEKALEYALKGLDVSKESRNENIRGQILLQVGDCYSELGDYETCDSLYTEAVEWLYILGKGRIFVPEAYIKLGDNARRSGDMQKARYYYERMLDETKLGYDQLQMYNACHKLSELLVDSDPEASRSYAAMADSLDFAPAVEAFGINLALSNLEFPRRERELQLFVEKQRTRLLVTVLILSMIIAGMLVVFLLVAKRALKHEETRNADLIKANLQKDALLSIARAVTKENDELHRISENEIPLPQVKLTKREIQIARLAAQGKINKEIADELNISVGTVAVHKNNLFRKLGVGNTVELMRYMQKIGL